MKIRLGFVSNSSDASFAIPLDRLTPWQIEAIKRHAKLGELLGISWADDEWDIVVTHEYIVGDTSMDNFDMDEFLKLIDVPERAVFRDSANGHWNTAMPPDWNEDGAREAIGMATLNRWTGSKPLRGEREYAMSDEEFLKEFLRTKCFETLEKMAERSDEVRRILSDPDFRIEI